MFHYIAKYLSLFSFCLLYARLCTWQQRLLQRPTSTRKPIQIKSTTASTSVTSTTANSDSSTPTLEIFTASKTKNEYSSGGPTSTFDDLLNSFQKEALTTTTRRPQLTTFSDADDIAFLKGLVRIKTFCLIFFFYYSSYIYSVDYLLSLFFYSNWIIARDQFVRIKSTKKLILHIFSDFFFFLSFCIL